MALGVLHRIPAGPLHGAPYRWLPTPSLQGCCGRGRSRRTSRASGRPVLAQVKVVTDAMQPDRQQADSVPVVEPLVDERQLGSLGPDEHSRQRDPEATSPGVHGTTR